MNKDKKLTILIILIVTLSLVGIGIAFAAFSQTLTINGSAEVEASSWQVVFEGMTNVNTIDAPTTTGSANEVTHPTIKNQSTEISNYEVALATPGDSVTYNFRIHNKGDYAASVSSVTIASGVNLTTNTSKQTSEADTLNSIEYKLYYTDTNKLVGQDPGKDCLEPGEVENVSLRIVFSSSSETDTSVLPSSNLLLDNLSVSVIYNQHSNGSCTYEPSEPVTDAPFQNIDGAYYTFEGKSFIGTEVNDVIISETITSKARYASAEAAECSDGSTPIGSVDWNRTCPEGTTPLFTNTQAASEALNYCTGCRLITREEVCIWGGTTPTCSGYPPNKTKIIGKYNAAATRWWIADSYTAGRAWSVDSDGRIVDSGLVTGTQGVRPVTDIPSTATISGSGTKTDPYVITP